MPRTKSSINKMLETRAKNKAARNNGGGEVTASNGRTKRAYNRTKRVNADLHASSTDHSRVALARELVAFVTKVMR